MDLFAKTPVVNLRKFDISIELNRNEI